MTLRTKITNNKQKPGTDITDITTKNSMKLPNKFKNLPHLGYNKKQVHNELT